MRDFRCVEVPARMRDLPRDRRGYPIPVVVYRDGDGRPHFTINSDVERARVIERDLCSICGQPLHRGRWFVGGPRSALSRAGAYVDPPVHAECCRYALRVCPYLATTTWAKKIDDRVLSDRTGLALVDETSDPSQPPVFVAVMAVGQEWVLGSSPGGYVRPRRPYRSVEYWRGGEQLTEREARAYLPDDVEAPRALRPPRLYLPRGRPPS